MPLISHIQTSGEEGGSKVSPDVEARVNEMQSGGQALPDNERVFFETGMGYDFSHVRIHTDANAVQTSRALNARAFTFGNHIAFNAGAYHPVSNVGRRLLAHELAHVVQQDAVSEPRIQAQFCTPYSSRIVAHAVRQQMLSSFIPAITATFGLEVGTLWLRFLGRRPGASLTPRVFSAASSSVVQGFINSATTAARQTALVGAIKRALPGNCPTLPPNRWTSVPVSTFLTPADLNYPINFDQVFEIPGNIAGGVSGSAAGPDTRQVSGDVKFRRATDGSGNTTDVRMKTDLDFVVRDAVDFCPGGAGAGIEQILTVPLSRLEATGLAYDVPFEVRYKGDPVEESLPATLVSSCWPSSPGGTPPATGGGETGA